MQFLLVALLLASAALGVKSQTNSIQLRNGSNTTTLIAPAGGNYTLTLPASAGTSGQALTTNGSGTLSWGAVASSIDGLSDAKSGGTDFSNSLILGHQATGTLSAASNNTAVGYGSLQAITSGDDNTALGYNALYAVQDGWGLTAIGSGALQAAGSATRTVAIGYQAGYNVTNSSYSVFVGYESGKSYSTTGAAVGLGYRALYNSTGAHNIGLGLETLLNTSGANNVAIGSYTAGNVTTGTNNVALGYGAAAKIVAGSGNVILGYTAGPTANASNGLYIDNTETNTPLIYGDFSGNTLTFNGATTTTGTSAINGVVSIGGTTAAAGEIRLLEDLDDGSHYTAFKAQAQAADVTYTLPAADGTGGYYMSTNGSGTLSWAANSLDNLSDAKVQGADFPLSVILGHESTGTLSSAENNTGVGIGTLQSLTSGDNNTVVGTQAGWSVTSGERNTLVGSFAGRDGTGSNNTYLGSLSGGPFDAATSGSGNTGIGATSLNQLTTGSSNVALGQDAGFFITTGSRNVFIGYQAGSDATLDTESDMLMIDNAGTLTPLIQGDFANDWIRINGSLGRNYRNDVTGGTHTVTTTDSWIVVDRGGTTTVTLPNAATFKYRELMFKTVQAQTVISDASNVVPLAGGAAGTAILPAVDGAWATLVSDGTNWVIMQSGQ